jgi:hypothetical protein
MKRKNKWIENICFIINEKYSRNDILYSFDNYKLGHSKFNSISFIGKSLGIKSLYLYNKSLIKLLIAI